MMTGPPAPTVTARLALHVGLPTSPGYLEGRVGGGRAQSLQLYSLGVCFHVNSEQTPSKTFLTHHTHVSIYKLHSSFGYKNNFPSVSSV